MKPVQFALMIFYLAAVAYGIFLTAVFRLPAPMVFCVPLVFFWKERSSEFMYFKLTLLLCISVFLYEVVGLASFNSFFAASISIILCAVYFSYYVHYNKERFNWSVWIFYGLLLVSALVMVANHYYQQVDNLRGLVLGDIVKQSPAGFSPTQFGFGYQLAAFVAFALISTFVFKWNALLKILVFASCVLFVFLGMQRSVFVGFAFTTVVFLLLYYRFKAVVLLALMIGVCVAVYASGGKDYFETTDNILTKNEHNDEASNRSDLALENLRIFTAYPYGLIFYGKTWGDVIYRNYVFSAGITSHNAYLMFLTYLGPFLGLGLLAGVYSPVLKIIFRVMREIHTADQPMLLCLVFSFISVSINALSHNAWLFSADGPTIFSFFSLLHCYKMRKAEQKAKLLNSRKVISVLQYA